MEQYTFGTETYRPQGGQFLLVPERLPASVAVPAKNRKATVGLCVFLQPCRDDLTACSTRPLLLPAAPFALGKILSAAARTLDKEQALSDRQRRAVAGDLVREITANVRGFAADVDAMLRSFGVKKAETSWSQYQRLEVARALMHEVTNRPLGLAEIARHAPAQPLPVRPQFSTPSSARRRAHTTGISVFAGRASAWKAAP